VESERIQDTVQRISNAISNLNLENYYQQPTRNLIPVPQMKESSSKSIPKSTAKPKPKQQLSIQESIDLQQKILSGS
jgi:hypothetical protein